MENQNIIWYSVERDLIPQTINGIAEINFSGIGLSFGSPRIKNGYIAIAAPKNLTHHERVIPTLILTEDTSRTDIFSWLSTYSPETFPLSQFARVVSAQDWENFTVVNSSDASKYKNSDRWASVILGEILAQGESEIDLANLPLSRSAACFSFAVARTSLIYKKKTEAFIKCVSRLERIEIDPRFTRRPISVVELKKIWGALHDIDFQDDSPETPIEEKIKKGTYNLLASSGISRKIFDLYFSELPGLFRNSIEDRVLAFQELISRLRRRATDVILDTEDNLLIAVAAILVGRGTSHIFLLHRIRRNFPSAILWFSAISATVGSKFWDPQWKRACRGIEKQLRQQFHWFDPATSDLCWEEYDWLSDIFDGQNLFGAFYKNSPNVLSVEIVPGASCQLRLTSSVGRSVEQETNENAVKRKSVREVELEAFAAEILAISDKGRHLIFNLKNEQTQNSFFNDDPLLSSKAPKKRARGGSGFDR